MSYQLTFKQSPNYIKGSPNRKIKFIVIHWWDDPKKKPTMDGTVRWLCSPKSRVSAHYVAEAGKVFQLVKEKDMAWHSVGENHESIGIECNPRQSKGDYQTIAELVRDIRKRRGKLPLRRHSELGNTTCPGTYNLKRIDKLSKIEPKLNESAKPRDIPSTMPVEAPTMPSDEVLPRKVVLDMESKKVWESKTMWAALTAVVTGIGLFATGEQSLEELLISVMGIVFGVLRLVTNSEVKVK